MPPRKGFETYQWCTEEKSRPASSSHPHGQAGMPPEHQGAAGCVLFRRAGDLRAISISTALWVFCKKKRKIKPPPVASRQQCHRQLSISTSTQGSGQTLAAPTPLACSVCNRTPDSEKSHLTFPWLRKAADGGKLNRHYSVPFSVALDS